jgi:hypothetical protein
LFSPPGWAAAVSPPWRPAAQPLLFRPTGDEKADFGGISVAFRSHFEGAGGPGTVTPQTFAQESLTLRDQVAVPERTVLVRQADQVTVSVGTRGTPGRDQQQERQQAPGLRLAGQQAYEQAPQPYRLGREIVAGERVARARRVALGEIR